LEAVSASIGFSSPKREEVYLGPLARRHGVGVLDSIMLSLFARNNQPEAWMTRQDFDKLVAERLAKITSVLSSKGTEYSGDGGDRLHNFKVAARISGETPEKALWGMVMKHLVSVIDIINDLDRGIVASKERVDEKVGDTINYLILLEGLLEEREVPGVSNKFPQIDLSQV
jgi:hypothetical protein